MSERKRRRWIWLLLLLLAAFVVGWAARPIPPQKYTEEEIKALRDELAKAKLEPVTIVREIEKIVPGPVRTRTVVVSEGRVERAPADVASTPPDLVTPSQAGPAVPPEGQPGGVVGGMHDCLDPAALTVDLAGSCRFDLVDTPDGFYGRQFWTGEAYVIHEGQTILEAHRGPVETAHRRLEAIRDLRVGKTRPGTLAAGLGATSAPGVEVWGAWWRRGRRLGAWAGVEYDLDPESIYRSQYESFSTSDRWRVAGGVAFRIR